MLFSNDLLLPALLLVLGFICGYLTKSLQRNSLQKRVREMEQEMLNDHAEILKLHQEKVVLQQQLKESKIPVITMSKAKEAKPEDTLAKQAN